MAPAKQPNILSNSQRNYFTKPWGQGVATECSSFCQSQGEYGTEQVQSIYMYVGIEENLTKPPTT